jgi:hypothetical protein
MLNCISNGVHACLGEERQRAYANVYNDFRILTEIFTAAGRARVIRCFMADTIFSVICAEHWFGKTDCRKKRT